MSPSKKPVSATRKAAMAARSGRAAESQTTTATPFPTCALYAIGLGLTAISLAVLAVFLVVTATGGHLRDLVGAADWGDNLTAAPFLVLMVAAAPLFLAEYQRRGAWTSRDRGFFQGGSNVVLLRPLRTVTRLLWLVATVAIWGILLALPVWLAVWHGWFNGARDDFWMLTVFYGFVAAGFSGAILGSLLKAVTYDRLAAVFGSRIVHGSASQIGWRMFSYQFRLELWFAFISAGTLGTLPALYRSAARHCGGDISGCVLRIDHAWLTTVLWVVGVSAALSLVGILNSWRSGKSLYSLESVS